MHVTRPSARPSRRRRLSGLVLSVSLTAALLLSPASAGALVTRDFFAWNGSQESVLSDMTIAPAAIRVGTRTIIAYQGTGYDAYVTSYDESTKQWDGPYLVGTNPLRLDAHGAPVLYLDDNRFIHVLWGGHSTQLQHAVSTSPESISSWTKLPPLLEAATYPEPVHVDNGETLLFFREGSADFFGWGMRRSLDGGSTFDDGYLTVLAGFGGASTGWYANFTAGKGGIVHCAFTKREAASGDEWVTARKNLYYIWRDSDGIWYNAQGRNVTLPVTLATADNECKIYDSGSESVNEVVIKEEPTSTPAPGAVRPSLVTTKTPGNAYIQFNVGLGRGIDAQRWMMARTTLPTVTISEIAKTDHTFDSGTFEPRLGGTIDSYIVRGGSDHLLANANLMEGRGGRIERWRSTDKGKTWAFGEVVSPVTPDGQIFGDPQIVRNDKGAPAPTPESTLVFTEWTNDPQNGYHRLYLWGPGGGLVERSYTPVLDRLAGGDRYATAIEISKAAYPSGAGTVLLATGLNYPDALAAAPLSAALRAPILLLPKAGVPSQVMDEIERLGATQAIILGSGSVVGTDVPGALTAKTPITKVERLAGADRYATALAVADRVRQALGRPVGKAIVASGRNYPDALAAGPLAAYSGYPIVLASAAETVPAELTQALSALGAASTIVVGGPPAVGTTFTAGLPEPLRLAGANRFETAAAISRYGLANGLTPARIMIASGMNFPDALAGSALGAQARAALLLTNPNTLSPATASVLTEVAPNNLQSWLLGGPPAVTNTVRDQAAAQLGAQVGKP